jgi:hypothetical protein
VGALLDAVRNLINILQQLLSKRCECMNQDDYNALVSQLNQIISQLQQWLSLAKSGIVGEEVEPEKPG